MYKSKTIKVTDEIYTPIPERATQYGTARWISNPSTVFGDTTISEIKRRLKCQIQDSISENETDT